jgi:predicted aminopeptidase
MARHAADELAARGFDVNLRPSGAFSTLGWFNDPLLSTAVTRDSMELAATVFHEIAHNTLWVKGAVAFNESYAQYVGYHAAADFFAARKEPRLAQRALDRWHDEMVLAGYYAALVARLEHLYSLGLSPAQVDSGRAEAARWALAELRGPVGPQLRTYKLGRLTAQPINNARLIGVLLYRTHLDLFDAWHARHAGDLRAAVADLARLMKGVKGDGQQGDSAFARLSRAIGRPAAAAGSSIAADTTPPADTTRGR